MYLLYHCHFVIEKNIFGYTAASEEFLELTKSALLAALEGIMLTTPLHLHLKHLDQQLHGREPRQQVKDWMVF